MIKVYFSIGNDYHCHCCRVTEEYEREHETVEEAVNDCVDMARGNWDICVSLVEGVEDSDAVEKQIYAAVEAAKAVALRLQRIASLRASIKENQGWLNNQKIEAARRQRRINEAKDELAVLGEVE